MPSTKPVHLFFNRHDTEDWYDPGAKEKFNELGIDFVVCNSWNTLSDLLQHKPIGISVGANELKYGTAIDIVNMINTLCKLIHPDYKIPIAVSICKDVTYDQIKELQKSEILGIVPFNKDFGVEESVKGLQALWQKIPYWPKHILEKLPGNAQKKKPTTNEIKLTTRQKQIYSLVSTRGVSNKIIAKTLNISESTVKLHMSAILKKYGVRNRTQLAVFANSHET